MTPTIGTVIYPVTDLERGKAVFRAILGSEPVMDTPYYVQFDADGQEIGLDPHGASKGLTGPLPYWHVADIQAAVAGLVEAGAREHQAVQDLGGRLIATVEDSDGNLIGLVQPA